MLKPLLFVAVALLVVTVGVYAYVFLWSGEGLRSPEELAQVALGDGPDEEKVKAALALADWARPDRDPEKRDAAREQMRRVLQKSTNADIRGAVIQGLGELRDVPTVPELLKVLRDPRANAWLRGTAASAVSNILQYRFKYNPNGAKDDQDRAIDEMNKEYRRQLKAPPESG